MPGTAIYQQYSETTAFVLPLYIFTIIVGSIGNGIVIRAYQKDKKTRNVYHLLITNLAMADLILCALFTPILLVYRSNASTMLVAKTPICEASIFLSMLSISMMYAIFPLLAFHRKDVMINPREPKLSFKQTKSLTFWFWVACAAVSLGLVGMAWSIFLSSNSEPKFYRCLLINTEIDAFTIYFLGYSSSLYGVSIFVTVSIYCKIYKVCFYDRWGSHLGGHNNRNVLLWELKPLVIQNIALFLS